MHQSHRSKTPVAALVRWCWRTTQNVEYEMAAHTYRAAAKQAAHGPYSAAREDAGLPDVRSLSHMSDAQAFTADTHHQELPRGASYNNFQEDRNDSMTNLGPDRQYADARRQAAARALAHPSTDYIDRCNSSHWHMDAGLGDGPVRNITAQTWETTGAYPAENELVFCFMARPCLQFEDLCKDQATPTSSRNDGRHRCSRTDAAILPHTWQCWWGRSYRVSRCRPLSTRRAE